MTDLIINNKNIAIIFEESKGVWKIAFGDSKKKILPGKFECLDEAIGKAKKMGFGGYRSLPNKGYHTSGRTKTRVSIKTILEKSVVWVNEPASFVNERRWSKIYSTRSGMYV